MKININQSQNKRDLNRGVFHHWSIFGDSNSNRWWVMVRKSSKWVNLHFKVKFVQEGHGQSPHKTIGILTKIFYKSGPNLVILARMVDELLCGQACDCGHKDTHIHRQPQFRRPKLACCQVRIKLDADVQAKEDECVSDGSHEQWPERQITNGMGIWGPSYLAFFSKN